MSTFAIQEKGRGSYREHCINIGFGHLEEEEQENRRDIPREHVVKAEHGVLRRELVYVWSIHNTCSHKVIAKRASTAAMNYKYKYLGLRCAITRLGKVCWRRLPLRCGIPVTP